MISWRSAGSLLGRHGTGRLAKTRHWSQGRRIAGPGFDSGLQRSSRRARARRARSLRRRRGALIPADADTLLTNNIKTELFRARGEDRSRAKSCAVSRASTVATRTVRPISIRTGVLPAPRPRRSSPAAKPGAGRVATLGTKAGRADHRRARRRIPRPFMLHYNMPPVRHRRNGPCRFAEAPEIGHGRLAKPSLVTVLPPERDFSYSDARRLEITESNGSSSMASFCGGSLALMDAGSAQRHRSRASPWA